MAVEYKSTFDRLRAKKKSVKEKTSFFLSKDVYADFKEICEDEGQSVSVVVEDLMRQIIESKKK